MIGIGSLWVQEGECFIGRWLMEFEFWIDEVLEGRESCWGEKIGWGKEEWG